MYIYVHQPCGCGDATVVPPSVWLGSSPLSPPEREPPPPPVMASHPVGCHLVPIEIRKPGLEYIGIHRNT